MRTEISSATECRVSWHFSRAALRRGRDWKADLSFPLFPSVRVDEKQMWSTSGPHGSQDMSHFPKGEKKK